jgi:hypothetical protein
MHELAVPMPKHGRLGPVVYLIRVAFAGLLAIMCRLLVVGGFGPIGYKLAMVARRSDGYHPSQRGRITH